MPTIMPLMAFSIAAIIFGACCFVMAVQAYWDGYKASCFWFAAMGVWSISGAILIFCHFAP